MSQFILLVEAQVLVIAWARVPHVGYWHGSGLEPKGRRPVGLNKHRVNNNSNSVPTILS